MALTYVTLVLDLEDGAGSPAVSGTASFAPSAVLTDAGTAVVGQAPVVAVFRAGQQAQARLLATDSAGPAPAGWAWQVTFTGVAGAPAPFSFFLPLSAGAVQYLSDLVPVASPVVMAGYLPLPAGAPAAGDVPVATGAGEASAWGPSGTGGVQVGGDLGGTDASPEVTGLHLTVPVTQGGTGQVTAQAAADALTGTQHAGYYLRSDGTHATLAAVAAADLPAATTAIQGAVRLDGTAADIAALGTQAAGSTGKAADAGHVHPAAGVLLAASDLSDVASAATARGNLGLGSAAVQPASAFVPAEPWQFPVAAYGAKGDGKAVYDGAMTSGQATLTCAASAPFTSADAGKAVLVAGAGNSAATATLVTTISAYTSASEVTLAASALSAVTAAGVLWGSDDTVSVRDTVTAATAYALSGSGYAQVTFDDAIYVIAAAPAQGGATKGNAQIPLPVQPMSSPKVVLEFTGAGSPGPSIMFGANSYPQISGTVLACARTDGANDATYGPASVIGGPTPAQGYGQGTFSNTCPAVDGITFITPYSPSYQAMDLIGCCSALVGRAAVTSWATPAMMSNPNASITARWPCALRLPSASNDGAVRVGWYGAAGQMIGAAVSDHAQIDELTIFWCVEGIQAFTNYSGTPSGHPSRIALACVESCYWALYFYDGAATRRIFIGVLDTDGGAGGPAIYDPDSGGRGMVTCAGQGAGQLTVTGAGALRVLDADQPPGVWGSPPAVPASGTAQRNTSWRDATVIIQSGTATVTAVAVGGTALAGVTSGAVRVPSGQTVTLSYTGGTPAWQWVLD